jgi:uncharacterized protein (DUF697 family)
MQNKIYIVAVDNEVRQHAEKLAILIAKRDIICLHCTIEEYRKVKSLQDIMYNNNEKFLFMGTDFFGNRASDVPHISKWQFKSFGRRIGWKGNNCVMFARDRDLPMADCSDFERYCIGMKVNHPDIVMPPENVMDEAIAAVQKLFGNKDTSIHSYFHAQYSTMVYEFIDNMLLDRFINSSSNTDDQDDELPDIKELGEEVKNEAVKNMTPEQAVQCNIAIHTAAAACAAVAFIPIPVADFIPITAAQVTMVISLGAIFGNKISKADAQVLIKTIAAPLVGRALAKIGFSLIPFIGWGINAAIAASITEVLGWTVANDFASKLKE